MAHSIYRRLTARARTLGGFTQLWIAADHILLVRSTRFSEHYQRFALADIQAVVITEESSRTPLLAATGATALLWALIFLLVSSMFAKLFFAITGGIALLWVIADMARGARCRCHLHTAVSRELIPPVSRMRKAREFLAKLQPAIESVQGAVLAEHIPAIEERTSAFAASAGGSGQPPQIVSIPGYLAETVFGVFLINAAMILTSALFQRGAQMITNALVTTLFGEVIVVVVALIRRGRDPRRVIYPLMMIALLAIGWDVVIMAQHFGGYIASVYTAAQRGANPQAATFWSVFDRSHAFIAAAWRAGIGAAGLAAALWERQGVPATRVEAVTQ